MHKQIKPCCDHVILLYYRKKSFDENDFFYCFSYSFKFPDGSVVKNPPANAGDSSTPGLGRSPGGGNGNPLQDSCLENPRDRRVWLIQSKGSQRVRQSWARTHAILLMETAKGVDFLFSLNRRKGYPISINLVTC